MSARLKIGIALEDSVTLLEIKNLSKSFGSTKALVGVNMRIAQGRIHSLVGKNGAGKSTLVNVIAGVYREDSGSVFFADEDITKKSLSERQRLGIRIVTQHASVIPHISVAENISVGLWPRTKYGLVDWRTLNRRSASILKEYGIDAEPEMPMLLLDPVTQRKINIVRALFGGGKLIILDEPTTSLSSNDREKLFDFIRELTSREISFVFISHYLDEVLKLSPCHDDITVIRDGVLVPIDGGRGMETTYLANLLAGEDVVLTKRERRSFEDNVPVVLSCRDLRSRHLAGVSLSIKKGEIIGLIGFPGSGAQEFCRALYGLSHLDGGTLELDDREVKISDSSDALENDIVYIPHDRHKEGIIKIHSIKQNICLPILKKKLLNRLGLIVRKLEEDFAERMRVLLNIKSNGIDDILDSLSGGNQQKVVVAKALASRPKCLVLDEPTIGIDIKSREEILAIVDKNTELGMCAFYYTNDFEELVRISDKLVFFEDGKIKDIRVNEGLGARDIIEIRDIKRVG
jgi:ABC-type sugar transport system ATPase subunit